MRLVLAAGRGDRADRAERAAARVPQDAGQRHHQLAATSMVPVLAEPDALPRAQRQLAVRNWDTQRRAQEAGLYVCWL